MTTATHFEPITNEPDRCANCHKPSMDHHSGQCAPRAEEGRRRFIENGDGHFSVYSDEVTGRMSYVGTVKNFSGRWSATKPRSKIVVGYAATRRKAVEFLL